MKVIVMVKWRLSHSFTTVSLGWSVLSHVAQAVMGQQEPPLIPQHASGKVVQAEVLHKIQIHDVNSHITNMPAAALLWDWCWQTLPLWWCYSWDT